MGVLGLAWLCTVGLVSARLLTTDREILSPLTTGFRLFVFPMWVIGYVPTWVDVGRDGIAWRWLFVRRFAPMSKVVPTPLTQGKQPGLVLTLHGGEDVKFIFRKEFADAPRHIKDAWSASRESADPVDPVHALSRETSESIEAWMGRLRAVSASAGTYRGVPKDRLWELAADNSSSLESRCGALLVLASTDDARERVRVLSSGVVSPAARALFERVADGAPIDEIASLLAKAA